MKTICSFCNEVVRPGKTPEDPVSHGICKACYNKILAEHGINIRKFLDMLDAPVFLVDNDVNVLAANAKAVEIAGKPLRMVTGNLCGEVFECRNAYLPGGCGKTVYCSGCAIRASVNQTNTTGIPVIRRPAVINRKEEQGGKTRLYISTKKEGDIILLRVEPAVAGAP